jgi:hypothetical protein
MPENDPIRLCSIIDPLFKLSLRGAQRRGNRQLTDSALRDCRASLAMNCAVSQLLK